jgi:hypothetical protein
VNRVSQIDYVLASDALLKRIRAAATSSQKRLPHIERSGLSFKRGTGKNADKILPAKLSYFEPDAAFDKDALGKNPEAKKIPFDFKRLPSVADDPLSPISDHAPVKIWLK